MKTQLGELRTPGRASNIIMSARCSARNALCVCRAAWGTRPYQKTKIRWSMVSTSQLLLGRGCLLHSRPPIQQLQFQSFLALTRGSPRTHGVVSRAPQRPRLQRVNGTWTHLARAKVKVKDHPWHVTIAWASGTPSHYAHLPVGQVNKTLLQSARIVVVVAWPRP